MVTDEGRGAGLGISIDQYHRSSYLAREMQRDRRLAASSRAAQMNWEPCMDISQSPIGDLLDLIGLDKAAL